MIALLKIVPFLGSLTGRLTLAGSLILALVALRSCDVAKQRRIGAERTINKIEKANDHATKLGTRAADKSRSGGVRGTVDPTTRND